MLIFAEKKSGGGMGAAEVGALHHRDDLKESWSPGGCLLKLVRHLIGPVGLVRVLNFFCPFNRRSGGGVGPAEVGVGDSRRRGRHDALHRRDSGRAQLR